MFSLSSSSSSSSIIPLPLPVPYLTTILIDNIDMSARVYAFFACYLRGMVEKDVVVFYVLWGGLRGEARGTRGGKRG